MTDISATDQRIASILWHIEDAVRGSISDASGSLLYAARFEALSWILLGIAGMLATLFFIRKHLGEKPFGHRLATGLLLTVFIWLALHPLNWAIVIDPEIGVSRNIITMTKGVVK